MFFRKYSHLVLVNSVNRHTMGIKNGYFYVDFDNKYYYKLNLQVNSIENFFIALKVWNSISTTFFISSFICQNDDFFPPSGCKNGDLVLFQNFGDKILVIKSSSEVD